MYKSDRRKAACKLLSEPAQIASLIGLFEALAGREGWHPGNNLRIDAYRSTYFAGYVGKVLAGGLQLVVGTGSEAMPTQRVWPEIDLSGRADVAHAVVLALLPEYRVRYGLFWGICVEMWKYCVEAGISEIWMETTPDTLRLYRRIGWPLEIMGDLRVHWGEPCYLCRLGVSEVADALAVKAQRSSALKTVVDTARGAVPELLLTKAA